MNEKYILDVCCGARMFWHNKSNENTIFQDCRIESPGLIKERPNFRVDPQIKGDFRNLAFKSSTFKMIVFDPPHLIRAGETGWMRKKYGALVKDTWREDLRKGFCECWRVLANHGTLIFKWNEEQIKHHEVLRILPMRPLFGHLTGKSGKTKWFCFMKIPEVETS